MIDRRLLIVALPCLLFWHWLDPVARQNDRGVRLLGEKNNSAALAEFLAARGRRPDEPALQLNTALALYQLGKFAEAGTEWEAAGKAKRPLPAGMLDYDLGNAQFRQGRYDQALASYRRSLLQNPGDRQAKKNLELTQKKIQEQKEQEEQKKDPSQQQQQQQQQPQQQPPQKKYDPIMQYLDQNERKQLEKKKQSGIPIGLEKDW